MHKRNLQVKDGVVFKNLKAADRFNKERFAQKNPQTNAQRSGSYNAHGRSSVPPPHAPSLPVSYGATPQPSFTDNMFRNPAAGTAFWKDLLKNEKFQVKR